MIKLQKPEDCTGCGACDNLCPTQSITLSADAEGFWYPCIDQAICIGCGACVRSCPVQKPSEPKAFSPSVFAAASRNESQRLQSSSGGVFSLLAEYVLGKGGVVFGAAFTEDCKAVHHIAIQNTRELKKLQGAKYLQSHTAKTYPQVKAVLDSGKTVLYTGTPCQIEGLYAYLGKDDEHLYTQSVVCHGVASPLLWESYARFREQTAGHPLKAVSFREKKPSWKHYWVKMDFEQETQYQIKASEDPYMRCYLKNYSLRPSCYRCRFKGDEDKSDLTLGDFWGIQYVLPQWNDDRGTSLILVRSEKGKKLLERIAPFLNLKAVDAQQAMMGNPAVIRSVKRPGKRKRFMLELQKERVSEVPQRYGRETAMSKTISRLSWYRASLIRKLRK